MTPKSVSKLNAMSLIIATMLVASFSFAAEIERSASQPQMAPVTITKTVYRTETYSGPYDEEVPYIVEEPYIENIPYQEYESYTDHEDYYTHENSCRMVTERDSKGIPHTKQECRLEYVRKTRPVTKHRWVTKHRQETRYRRVTKHRTETRCCKTQTRQVADRKFDVAVDFHFPAEASLVGHETEKFLAYVEGEETTATIVVKSTSAIYSYEPQVTRLAQDRFSVFMKLIPTYTAEDLGQKTIDQMQISVLGKAVSLNFIDLGSVRKVQTQYDLSLFNAQGAEILRAQYDAENQSEVHWALPVSLVDGSVVTARLQVRREGRVISAPVDFTVNKEFKVLVEEIYDADSYMDEKLVGKFSYSGEGSGLVIYFRDQTKNIASVKTTYTLTVQFNSFGPRVTKTLRRDQLKVTSDGRIVVGALKDLGFTRTQLAEVGWGTGINIVNEVQRTATKFPRGVINFRKSVTLWTDGY